MQTLTLETLFELLLCQRNQTADFSTLGPWLQQQITTCIVPELHQIAFAPAAYTRNRIAQEETSHHKFEALVMRWDKQAQTPIHGHPAFSFYLTFPANY